MEITFLGTSSAVPSKYRNHAGIILKYFKETLLFDCGEGTQRQLTYAKISPMKIDKIFISHYHGDHILGLAGLIQSMGFRGRVEDLDIYGPKGLEKIINVISSYGYFQINFNINIHEIGEVLGIEAARQSIINEAQNTLSEQGLSVDVRHIMLVADIMTSEGRMR